MRKPLALALLAAVVVLAVGTVGNAYAYEHRAGALEQKWSDEQAAGVPASQLNVLRGGVSYDVVYNTGHVHAFLEEADRTLWVGASAGLYQIRDGKVVRALQDFPGVVDVRALARDRGGALWVGTTAGLYRLVEGKAP